MARWKHTFPYSSICQTNHVLNQTTQYQVSWIRQPPNHLSLLNILTQAVAMCHEHWSVSFLNRFSHVARMISWKPIAPSALLVWYLVHNAFSYASEHVSQLSSCCNPILDVLTFPPFLFVTVLFGKSMAFQKTDHPRWWKCGTVLIFLLFVTVLRSKSMIFH